jgi:hypothetical protein
VENERMAEILEDVVSLGKGARSGSVYWGAGI